MTKIILGSQSPRRREILGYFSLPFDQATPPFDEDQIPFQGEPIEYVCHLARGKALSLLKSYPDQVILTADTIVYRNGKIFGKPKSLQEAIQSFSELVGNWHTVYTGVAVRYGDLEFTHYEGTNVLFNPLNKEQIIHYLSRIEWADKAGGYAIQMAGGLIVNKIEGCYYNVMGLPINTVERLLKNVNIELWDYF